MRTQAVGYLKSGAPIKKSGLRNIATGVMRSERQRVGDEGAEERPVDLGAEFLRVGIDVCDACQADQNARVHGLGLWAWMIE